MDTLDVTIKNAETRAERNESMSDNSELKNLYNIAKKIGHANALNLARHAESQEERNFFAYIADMNLQRKQKQVVERNIF